MYLCGSIHCFTIHEFPRNTYPRLFNFQLCRCEKPRNVGTTSFSTDPKVRRNAKTTFLPFLEQMLAYEGRGIFFVHKKYASLELFL